MRAPSFSVSRLLAFGLCASLLFQACSGTVSTDAAGPGSTSASSNATDTEGSIAQPEQPDADTASNRDADANLSRISRSGVSPTPVGSVWPLTGLPADANNSSAPQLSRPAVVVKIDNHKGARPQIGLNEADVVYEQIVESGLTRLAAVFHSADVETVGPVRSARTSDYDILTNLGVPLFASSGGSAAVLAGLADIPLVNVSSHIAYDAYWRQPGRPAPHNLMTSTIQLREIAAETSSESIDAPPPQALFAFGGTSAEAPAEPVGTPVAGLDLDFGDIEVSYRWAPGTEGWLRTQNELPHVDTEGRVVAPANVIVQFVVYGRSEADPRSPQAELLGEGAAWVLTAGALVEGTWERSSGTQPTRFADLDGNEIELTPGQTWVALVRVGQATVVAD